MQAQYLSQHNARDITVHTNKKPLQKMGLERELRFMIIGLQIEVEKA